MEENKDQENRFADYSAPEPGSYNLNGTYYKSSQQYTGAESDTDSSRYDSPDSGVGSYSTGTEHIGTQYTGTQYTGTPYTGTPYGTQGQTANTFSYGNGDYSYNLNGQPPMDEKGRPLRNRFGMKLTFSILGIVAGLLIMCGNLLLGAIPLILSIVALVFACMQNKEYKVGNWQSFRNYARISAVLLWIDMAVWIIYLILFIIGLVALLSFGNQYFDGLKQHDDYTYNTEYVEEAETEEEPEEDPEEEITEVEKPDEGTFSGFHGLEGQKVPKVKGFNKFTLQGAKISLPMDMKDFYKAGFHISDDDEEVFLEPGDSYGYGYYDDADNYMGTLFIYNTTSGKIHPQNGIAGGITINGDDGVDCEMVGDLSFSSTREDAAAVLGADVTSLSEDGDYGYYAWYFEDGGYATSIEMDFKGEELKEVWIMNYQKLEQ